MSLGELLGAINGFDPQRTALVFRDLTMSYGEVASRAADVARLLDPFASETVALRLPRSFDLVVSLWGALASGATCLPLDLAYPEPWLRRTLTDSGARAIVTKRRPADRMIVGDLTVVNPTATAAHLSLNVKRSADSLCYLLYTSGSTGVPKGVEMPDRAIDNLIRWQIDHSAAIGVGRGRTIQFAPIGFDVAFQEILATLCAGGTLVLIDEDDRRDPRAFAESLARFEIERVFLPFVALSQLVEVSNRGVDLPALREVITAGEALHVTPAVRTFFKRHPKARLVNQYGPTETHVVTYWTAHGDPDAWPNLPPVGIPIPNVAVVVRDGYGKALPDGVEGEICVSGACLFRAYRNDPHLSAKNVRQLPQPEYRTGDIGSCLQGVLRLAGRIDQQLKNRGFRIEASQIESSLLEHGEVAQAAVAQSEDQRLVAYLVPRHAAKVLSGLAEREAMVDRVRAELDRKLPKFMVPDLFVVTDKLPLTLSGKLDRQTLGSVSGTRPAGIDRAFAEPTTDLEVRIAEIWRRILRIERVGMNDNFFDLGGHSLLLPRLRSELSSLLGCEVPFTDLFRFPSIRDFTGRRSRPEHGAQPAARGDRLERIAALRLRRAGLGGLR